MRVKFTKQWSGPYGVFVEGRECELGGPMLAAAPKDSYVTVIAEESKQAEAPAEMPSKAIQNNTKPSNAKKSIAPADKQQVTSESKREGKPKKDESKKTKSKKAERTDRTDSQQS